MNTGISTALNNNSMKIYMFVLLVFSPYLSFSQEYLLGEDKVTILNRHKNDCSVMSINDSTIEFNCGEAGYFPRTFKFKNELCVMTIVICTESAKNYYIAKYIEAGYRSESHKKLFNNIATSIVEFKNEKYFIQIASSKEKEFYLVSTSYLK